jgi:hypothetical protein
MSATIAFLQNAAAYASAVPLAQVVRVLFSLAAVAAFAMFFRPLLVGIARALVLTVRPRRTKEEQAARRKLRDARLLQREINSAHSPLYAAELRALAARS